MILQFNHRFVFSASAFSNFGSIMLLPKFIFRTASSFRKPNLKGTLISSRFLSICPEDNSYEALILKNTVVSENHLTPELKLRLITPECELWHCRESESEFPNDPFWGIYWPGGQALGRYILDNPSMFQHKTILDIGSGSGACALAAAKCGARCVLANDTDPVSLSAIRINSNLNNLQVHTSVRDLIGEDVDSLAIKSDNEPPLQLEWNVVLIGDMFYDTDFSCKLFAWLSALARRNKLVLVGDPGRHALRELHSMRDLAVLEKVAEYCLLTGEHNGFSNSSVFKVRTLILKALKVAICTSHAFGGFGNVELSKTVFISTIISQKDANYVPPFAPFYVFIKRLGPRSISCTPPG